MRPNIKKLEEVRRMLEMGVHDFSKHIGISHQTYYNLLAGHTDLSGKHYMSTISTIARKLRMPENLFVIFDR